MKRTTYPAVVFVLLILLGGLYYFFRPEYVPPADSSAQKATGDQAANIEFAGSTIVEQQNGKKNWVITAESIQVDPDTKDVQVINLKGTYYQENGGTIVVTAKQGKIDNATRDVVMEGDFKATTSDGTVLTASQAHWQAQTRHFTAAGGIRLTREDAVVTGDSIDSDDKMEVVVVKGNAHIIKGGEPQ